MDPQDAYELVAKVADPTASEGLNRPRSILLLWFLRNFIGIDDLDAYQFVCDGTDDRGIDGLFTEAPSVDDDVANLVLLQCRYPETPKLIGEADIPSFLGNASHFRTADNVRTLLASPQLEPELRSLITNLKLVERLEAGKLRTRLIFVTAGVLTTKAKELIAATNAAEGAGYLTAYDITELGPLAKAVLDPAPLAGEVTVPCAEIERFRTELHGRQQVVAAIRALDIVDWPGISDRSLFDLNVRLQLKANRVSSGLRRALEKKADHSNFLAFHNGLTVVCNSLTMTDLDLKVTDMSVVNGAQSVIALQDQRDHLTAELKLVVKFVEIGNQQQMAREVAWRSNNQNPVNPRNLRARSGPQLRLAADFQDNWPEYSYVTRPDATVAVEGRAIHNDHAAQLLCAVYTEKPWLAVRVLALFEDTYTDVFTPEITAAHVVLVDFIEQRVRTFRELMPEDYRRSAKLTELVAVYLVGQLLRTEPALEAVLVEPAIALSDRDALTELLDDLSRHAIASLAMRHEDRHASEVYDDFKVEFKNREHLRQLAADARKQYAYAKRTASPRP